MSVLQRRRIKRLERRHGERNVEVLGLHEKVVEVSVCDVVYHMDESGRLLP
jgi:hypothetical protein